MYETYDEFSQSSSSGGITCFEYVFSASKPLEDVLYCGTVSGTILQFPVTKRHRNRIDDFCHDQKGSITCMKYIRDTKILSNKDEGVLVSGSADRSLCVFYPHADNNEYLIQKLHGHDGTISAIESGKEGSIVSASIDGVFKIWLPQKGRASMKFPFFECTYSSTKSSSFDKVDWLQALAVKTVGVWTLYVGDSDGGIDVYKKGGGPSSEAAYAAFTGQVQLKTSWKNLHTRSISNIAVQLEDKLVISIGYDNTCKVCDCANGTVIISITNPRSCMFRSALYNREEAVFLLMDEVGWITTYSWTQEKVTKEFELIVANAKQLQEVRKSHKGALLGRASPIQDNFGRLFIHIPFSGGVRLVKEIRRSDEVCFRSDYHDSVIGVAPMVSLAPAGTPGGRKARDRNRFSSSEHLTFTADKDAIFCFTEFNQEELYQLRAPDRRMSEITFLKVLWDLSCVVTGHDNGSVVLWSTDSSQSRIFAHQLKNTVNCIIEAECRQSRALVAADHSGQIAVWNLTFLVKNPTELSLESLSGGFHDPEDPSILAMAYHPATKTMISSGSDCTLQMWRFGVDTGSNKYEAHTEPVCCLEVTNNTLVSGDMGGVVILWAMADASSHVTVGLRRLVVWSSELGIRAVISTLSGTQELLGPRFDQEAAPPTATMNRVYVAIAGVKDVATWCVDVVDYRASGENFDADDVLGNTDPVNVSGDSKDGERDIEGKDDASDADANELVTQAVFNGDYEDDEEAKGHEPPPFLLSRTARKHFELNVEKGPAAKLHGAEPTCLFLSAESKPSGTAPSASIDAGITGGNNEATEGPKYLYYGTVEGTTTRHKL
jgi:WD40 repeat protein